MTGKIMPLRERDTRTVQAAADAFLSSPRYANPNTRRGYTGVLDRLPAELGAGRPLAEASGEELAGLLEQLACTAGVSARSERRIMPPRTGRRRGSAGDL